MTTTIDFGTDIAETSDGDIDPFFRMETGPIVVAHRVLRRLTTAVLFYAEGQGIDLRQLLRAAFTAQQIVQLKSLVEAECEQDEYVLSAQAGVTYDQAAHALDLTIVIQTAAGPFIMTATIDALDAKLLGVH